MASKKKNGTRSIEDSLSESFLPSPSDTLPIEEAEKTKIPTVRHSGHFVDQKLKYESPQRPHDLFEITNPEFPSEIPKIELKIEGIKLTPPEERLTTALIGLLKNKSENTDTTSPHFYAGNINSEEVTQYGEITLKSALLEVSRSELYTAYYGSSDYSGKDVSDILGVITSLQRKNFRSIYDRTEKKKVGKKYEDRTTRIEYEGPVIQLIQITKDLSNVERSILDSGRNDEKIREKKGGFIFKLSPILTDQIDRKYVEYPIDINRRTEIASGGKQKVTQAINNLRDYLMRELSAKRFKCEINSEKLAYQLGLANYIKDKRKKLIREKIEDAINACKKLNLLLESEEVDGALGQKKWVFTINKDFE